EALDSTRSISAALMRRSLRFSSSSAASRACCSAASIAPPAANGDSGEGLVDVHAIELLSIGVEADDPMPAQDFRGTRQRIRVVLDFQPAQEAVAADGQQGRTEPFAKTLK